MPVWLETDYYPVFHCKCGACRHTCCVGWQIDVSEEEYFRLIGMNCSEKLHDRLECAFALPELPDEDAFRVMSLDWRGKCHLLDESGLCMLHKECGEECLPKICRFYPRSLRQEGTLRVACCSGSCEGVVELLLREKPLHFLRKEDKMTPLLAEELGTHENDLRWNCIRLLQNRKKSISERIDDVCAATGCEDSPGREQMDKAIQTLLELSPNLPPYLNREADSHPDTEHHKENLLVNHLAYMDFPFVDRRLKVWEAGYGLRLAYELLRLVDGHNGDLLTDAYAEAFRLIEHTAFYYNACLLLKREHSESPRLRGGRFD